MLKLVVSQLITSILLRLPTSINHHNYISPHSPPVFESPHNLFLNHLPFSFPLTQQETKKSVFMPPRNGHAATVVRKLSDQPAPLLPVVQVASSLRCLCGSSSTCRIDWGQSAQIRDASAGALMATSICDRAALSLIPSFLVDALVELLAGQFPDANVYSETLLISARKATGTTHVASLFSSSSLSSSQQAAAALISSELLRLLPTSRAVWQAALLGYDVVITPLPIPSSASYSQQSTQDNDVRKVEVLAAAAEHQRFACCDMLHDALFPAVEVLHRCCVRTESTAPPSTTTTTATEAMDTGEELASPFSWEGFGGAAAPLGADHTVRPSSPPPPSLIASVATSKVDQWLGILWSIAVHVTKQPMLERHCGPTAVMVCASPDQCDEVAWMLVPIAHKLNLVIHNLVDATFPLMPEDRRADIVVGTPLMLYHQFPIAPAFGGVPGGGAQKGEDTTVVVEPNPMSTMQSYTKISALAGLQRALGVPVAPFGGPNVLQASLANRKKYQLDTISQFAIMDAFGVLRTGQGPLVDAIVGSVLGNGSSSKQEGGSWACMFTRGMKPDAQFYIAGVTGAQSEAAAMRWLRLHRESKSIRFQDRSPLALISLVPLTPPSPPLPVCEDVSRKRPREEAPLECGGGDVIMSASTLVLRNCLSMAQLVRDPEVLHDALLAVESSLPADIVERRTWRATLGFVVLASRETYLGDDESELVLLIQCPRNSKNVAAVPAVDDTADDSAVDALRSVATFMRGQVLDGNPVIAVLIPTAALMDCVHHERTGTAGPSSAALLSYHQRHIDILTAARATCPAPLIDQVHVVASSSEPHYLNVWRLSENVCRPDDRAALPRGSGNAVSPVNSSGAQSSLVDRIFPPCTTMGQLTDVVQWLCAAPTEMFALWNGSVVAPLSNCTLVFHNAFARAGEATTSKAHVTSRPPRPAGVSAAEWSSRSMMEDLLAQCQTVGLVKSFLVHQDTLTMTLTLFVEYWTVAAAQIAFVLLQRALGGSPPPTGMGGTDEAVPQLEWASTSLYYEGVNIPHGFNDDGFPHPLDR